MTKINKTPKKFLSAIFSIMTLCLVLMFGVLLYNNPVYAISEKVTKLSNLDFSSNSITTSVNSKPTGWEQGLNESTTSGTINLNYYNKTNLNLPVDQVPKKLEGFDDYVLMINSKTSSESIPKVQYYKNTSSLTLDPYSTYKIKVYVQVTKTARASIYVNGLEEPLCFEGISYENASTWVPYNFYITTGLESKSVNLELWLGSKQTNRSEGAVFFDNVEITQLSEKDIDTTTARTKYVSYKSDNIYENFENGFNGWTKINELEENTYAEIINQSTENDSISKDIHYLGTDYSKGNVNALTLYTKEDTKSYFGYKSKDIELGIYDIVKVTANVKTHNLSGSAYVKIVENDVKDLNGNIIEKITPASTSLSITSNSTNKFNNNYQTCTFFIKGRNLYNTSYNIELWLGSEENKSSGIVAFDTITIEPVSYEEYSKATSGSTVAKLELESTVDSYTIKNSAFNDVQKAEKELTYPLIPANWTHNEKDSQENYFGVINTNETIYNANANQFGNFANPGNPTGVSTATETNNILLMHNINETYQSVKSSAFKIESNSYYKLSFAYKLLATDANQQNIFNVFVEDDANNILYTHENLTKTNGWETYTIYFNTKAYSNELNLILSLGTEENLVKGIAYIDNVMLVKEELTASEYEEISKENNVLDFQEGNFNLIKENSNHIHTPLRYNGKLEEGTQVSDSSLDVAFGGIIDASSTQDAYDIEKQENSSNTLNYIMMIQTMDQAKYSLTAKDNLTISANSYYKFTIDIKTQGLAEKDQKDSEEKYGAIFALSGLDEKIEGIVANNWTTYTIYVSSTDSTTVNLQFALKSLDIETSGIAYFDNYSYEVIDSDIYNKAVLNNEDNDKVLFIGNTDVKEDEEEDTTKAENDLTMLWYLIPTLLLAIALILALVAYLMKKVKIKKWEKKKVNSYDREKTVYRDVVRVEAERRRDEKVKEIKNNIAELEKEKAHMEEVHKEQLAERRASRQKGVTFNVEREFKQYAKMHTAIENRIANLKNEIESLNSAEYLLNLQHRIIVEKAKKERASIEKDYESKKKKK